ncbi:FAS1-like dehydratase domain-containing protein [Tsukamurella ocularis]|uniref:FAS1-like dehydratase domain-containing protein n=1 Tax=Tsukamurella ocularis TaxID=1970234 RepID=UPI0039EEF602
MTTPANPSRAPRPEGWEIWHDDAYEVAAEVVRGFARAVRDPHVPFGARGVLPADTPVPVTLLAAPMFDAASALVSRTIPQCNLSRIVHAAQQFRVVRPLRIGQRLAVGARLASHVVKANTDIIVIEVTAYADGVPHVEAVITIAHSAAAAPDVDLDAVADRIMLAGTGPSDSDTYTAGGTLA